MHHDITTIGFDLAKSVFQVPGINADGKVLVRRGIEVFLVIAALPGRDEGLRVGAALGPGAVGTRPRCEVDAACLREAIC
jgi:hypothetical protein